jgi:broad specificity phosphatase PhoE
VSGKTTRIRATRLTLLFRGATASNQQTRFSSDEPILGKELERATQLARALPAFEDVQHAPEISTAQTAAAFASKPTLCEALRDVDYGRWNGLAVADVAPDDLQRWMSDPSTAPHGGESFEHVRERAAAWLDSLHGTGGRRLAVTHGIVLKIVLAHVLGAPLTSIWRIDVEPLGSLSLSSDGRRWALRHFGSAA